MSTQIDQRSKPERRVTVDRRLGAWVAWMWELFNRRRGERREGYGRRQRVAEASSKESPADQTAASK